MKSVSAGMQTELYVIYSFSILCCHISWYTGLGYYYFFLPKDMFNNFREREEVGKREKHWGERETMIGCLLQVLQLC